MSWKAARGKEVCEKGVNVNGRAGNGVNGNAVGGKEKPCEGEPWNTAFGNEEEGQRGK